MAWKLKGSYVASCSCSLICPCAVDGKPTTASGKCDGTMVAKIGKGSLDGVDLSGVTIGMYIHLPSNFSAGNVRMALVVDEAASDEQAKALERIFSGQEGGMFGEFVPLIGEFAATERGKITVGVDKATIGSTSISFEPILAPDGSKTTVRNAPFGFAPEFAIGRTSGKAKTTFASYDQSFGETADFEWS